MSQSPNGLRALGFSLLLFSIWGVTIIVQQRVDHQMTPLHDAPDTLWITSGKVLRVLSVGNQSLLADVYWTRSVQYYGSRLRDHKTDFSLLDPLLNITVTLDPHLMIAYYYGSIYLSAKPPRGAGDPHKAIALLQKGIQANPDEWRLWHHLGFIYYWELQDYAKAAAAYQEGAKNPTARSWMKAMAAAIAEKGGNEETSEFLWERIYESSADLAIRNNAMAHIQSIRARKGLEVLESLAAKYKSQTGRWPKSIDELIAAGLLKGPSMDPGGFPYRMLANGKAALSPQSYIRPDYDNAPEPPSPSEP